jgi:hypothetical protein
VGMGRYGFGYNRPLPQQEWFCAFLYIVSYVNYASPSGKQGVVECSPQFFKTIIRRREGFMRVLCIVVMLIIHSHR